MGKCILCGKQGDHKIYCKKCYLKDNPILEKFKPLKIIKCSCGKVKKTHKWEDIPFKEAVNKLVKQKIILNNKYQIDSVATTPLLAKHKPGKDVKGEVEVIIKGHTNEYDNLEDEYILPLELEYSECNYCKKHKTDYFEAKVQIRNTDKSVLNIIKDPNKIKETKNGFDIYLASTKQARAIAKQLENMGAETKYTTRLHTRDRHTGKEVRRLTILAKMPDYKVGDIVRVDKKPYKILEFNPLTIKSIVTGKITSKTGEIKKLKIYKTKITKTHPELEALHPNTYQSTKIENPIDLNLNQNVKVVLIKNKMYLVK
ncbi:MAG: hypothetical protein MAG795_00316 [Candidatus Woesearchaeota archaeon]|nr:hypothetical protein [Candidatus Woesearchaeota archaeon]